jgi:peptidoglycan/LPS O-acetylase OafA/YrhL
MNDTEHGMSTSVTGTPQQSADRLPYLPGLDGLRAVAVIAVMIYHANHEWLSGGFLGVEVFFVISGYLITQLLVGEFERDGGINLRQFWKRRLRRLLPALFVLLSALAIYMTLFRRRPMGRTRGDFAGGIFYISNWYQIFVGQGYTANEAFVPLRHLWSLAVEEQFYLVWPLVMAVVLLRWRGRDLPRLARGFAVASLIVTVGMALLFHSGDVAATCTPDQQQGYFTLFGRCMSINESLYLGTISRAGGLLLGAAFALVWRPAALMIGRLRDKAVMLDAVGVLGIGALGLLMWTMWLSEGGRQFGIRFDPILFRGGFLLTGLATLAVIAGVTHQRSGLGRVLGMPVLNWIGTRSYGLYLYHWPIYQIIRGEAGKALTVGQFVLAMVLTLPITEASYRYIESPIRHGRIGEILRDHSRRAADVYRRRRRLVGLFAAVAVLVAFAGVSIVLAPNRCVGQVECDLASAAAPADSVATADTSTDTTTTTSPADVDGSIAVNPTSTSSTTSSSSTTSTTLPVDQRPPYAIGESVMLGAKDQLEADGFVVDAAESRQGKEVVDIVARLRAAGKLGNKVVIHIGTNGEVSDDTFAAIMASLPATEVKSVCFLTVRANLDWIAGNNDRILGLQAKYPNVHVGFWGDFVPNIKGMSSDGIHLKTAEAKKTYADLIKGWTDNGPC